MKKYRLTKITVKTREIVSVSKASAHEAAEAVCPFCHAPLATGLPVAEPPAKLAPPAADDQERK